ncbi:MAG: adenylyl-sulfate kinase [Holosporales bacterium]|jgi:adenylylsulfate kinase|nr:adenylyl-sulfate kinase [Holosporales bacterium]
MVIWITGFSGAGKTTLACAINQQLKEQHNISAILLDGDEIRSILDAEHKVSYNNRKTLAWSYAKLAKMLSDQGFIVIVATISMFEDIRQWNRQYNERYIEVYLRISEAERKRRDPKGLYKLGKDMVNASYEEPRTPDFCFDEGVSLLQQVQLVIDQCFNTSDLSL